MNTTTYADTSARGNHITVTRPTLTAEEREKRMKAIQQAVVQLVLATEKSKKQKNRNT